MTDTILYFVRHGESEANTGRIFANTVPAENEPAYKLTAAGREQALGLAEVLAGRQIDALYSSPLPRALQTAHILAEHLLKPPAMVQVAPELIEYHMGVLEGQSYERVVTIKGMTCPAIQHYLALVDAWSGGQLDERIPGGESYLDIVSRFVPFVRSIAVRHAGGRVLLVSHGGLYREALPGAGDFPGLLPNVTMEWGVSQGVAHLGVIQVCCSSQGQFTCLDWQGLEPQGG